MELHKNIKIVITIFIVLCICALIYSVVDHKGFFKEDIYYATAVCIDDKIYSLERDSESGDIKKDSTLQYSFNANREMELKLAGNAVEYWELEENNYFSYSEYEEVIEAEKDKEGGSYWQVFRIKMKSPSAKVVAKLYNVNELEKKKEDRKYDRSLTLVLTEK